MSFVLFGKKILYTTIVITSYKLQNYAIILPRLNFAEWVIFRLYKIDLALEISMTSI